MKLITDKKEYTNKWREHKLSILQSWEWGEAKRGTWEPIRITVANIPVSILTRKVPLTGKRFGYIPRVLNIYTLKKEHLEELKEAGNELGLSHLIIDPNTTKATQNYYQEVGFINSGTTIQPNQTNVVNLEKTEEELWMEMKGKYRRNYKKSARQGCKVEVFPSEVDQPLVGENSQEAVERFYKVMETIFARTSYVMFGLEYFEKVWKNLSKAGLAKIYIATKDGKDVGAYFVASDELVVYELYGGVTNAGRDVEAGYLLKWEAIKDAKLMGIKYYDHWGVAPMKDGEYEKGHELYHISKFKEGFGGEIINFASQQIAVYDQLSYRIYNIGKSVNDFLLKLKKRGK